MFKPSMLTVTFIAPITPFRPLESRRYTLAHSDTTGKLFLTIGPEYGFSTSDQIKDEVKAEWVQRMGEYSLSGKVHISGGEYDEQYSKVRYMIFKKEMELALTAIVYGDQVFYSCFPWLLDAPIYVTFESIYPEFQQTVYYGTPRKYLTAALSQAVK
ncbi:staygreen family protein [Neobacillus notoginsengisoli]|uniref:staygreen family protein n=1 Tax=Neobacillus notoginsengisoli TaxID=1578198 RepID=UPI001F007307|nr:staygreen family protein [Neobacillus notoginsengisoli]